MARNAVSCGHDDDTGEARCQEILDLLEAYGVRRCFYGHLHGGSHRLAISGQVGSVEYRLIAADYLGFRPEKLLD